MVAQSLPEDYPLTAAEFLLLPMEENRIYELLQGELIVAPPPEISHQLIVVELTVRLHAAVKRADFGKLLVAPAAVVLSASDVVEPDLFVIATAQLGKLTRHSFNGAPAIVFEILSPSNRRMDLQRKAVLYANAGVEEYWMVDPEKRRVLVQRLVDGKPDTEIITTGVVVSMVLPEFSISIDELFAPEPFGHP